ncbi:MAG: hypothetical protein GXP27_15440 [Planctomycetes bacterium]|nr:hypothetical protein [Planctomycetota bacterium]
MTDSSGPSQRDVRSTWPPLRAWNIAFRTIHIGVAGILCGGHVFNVPASRLHLWLWLTLASGAGLILVEAMSRPHWLLQARAAFVLLKLVLLLLIVPLWTARLWLLAMVIILASVGSHMPARFRYYSPFQQEDPQGA